ncbi:hypothetical protein [Nannocystis radixulma]|uniref:Uncharacterized protein n=1 Tax=Nannocystis radixulma TaxID=2995305 RepID=A0ABT5B6U0_9BACT|nr:hypothetical protein [Nannocystis radixulma]MDC0669812.1 hypothetical protein [Nannocystis radixulma]
MKMANIHPELMYAFKRTGMIVTEENMHSFDENDIAEWDEAIDEYRTRQHRRRRWTR